MYNSTHLYAGAGVDEMIQVRAMGWISGGPECGRGRSKSTCVVGRHDEQQHQPTRAAGQVCLVSSYMFAGRQAGSLSPGALRWIGPNGQPRPVN